MDTQTPAGGEIPQLFPLVYKNCFDSGLTVSARDNIEYALSLGLPELQIEPMKRGKCILVGGAPSIRDNLDDIKRLSHDKNSYVFAVNQAYDWLIDNGVRVDATCAYEIGSNTYKGVFNRASDAEFFVSSISFPEIFEEMREACRKVTLWHCYTEEADQLELLGNRFQVCGGTATLHRCMSIALIKGFRDFAMFGADSSFEGDSHITGKPYDGKWSEIDIVGDFAGEKRTFRTYPYLARQADEFKEFFKHHHFMFSLKVYGTGLLPSIHRHMFPQFYEEEN
jgi:hypothetical protein